MPGILPMKVIKVGTSAQSRIAQACDRCRSKKIRCDGVTPCCSQCTNVGFECKTSDKLSRRAFPRGYTESLEDRVRALESEVRELKDLLDEKDEKIDLLSKIHSFSPKKLPSTGSTSAPSQSSSPEASPAGSTPGRNVEDEVFHIQQSPFLLESEQKSDYYFMGASSGRSFVDSFKSRIQETGKSPTGFNNKALFAACDAATASPGASLAIKLPPRLVSDQMVNVFFQEWAPLFPVLHQPTFLQLYADFVANPESVKEQQSIAQLQLVFAIAALSTEANSQDVQSFEVHGLTALQNIVSENTFGTLQCLLLAQIYCINKADYKKLLYYTGIAVNLSYRLGLHQNQKRFSLGTLTHELRKRVFWTLYTLDCFCAALLGLPKLMRDDDIHTEDPADVDDENITERGFQPGCPGESTRISGALALFRAARMLSKVLTQVYPAATYHELSLQKIAALSEELDAWRSGLPVHLQLRFVQDKPSTNVVSSRSPLLSVAYYYIRTLIHRPVAGSSLGSKASSSVLALADSGKHIIQIVQLLEERRMSFSFCLNKNELLILSGFGLLFQGLDLKEEGKLIKESQRLVCSAIGILERSHATGASSFKKIASSLVPIDYLTNLVEDDANAGRSPGMSMLGPQTLKSTRKQLQAIASRFSFGGSRAMKDELPLSRRATMSALPTDDMPRYSRADSQLSLTSVQSEPALRRLSSESGGRLTPPRSVTSEQTNLDYLSFHQESISAAADQAAVSDWNLVGYVDDTGLLPYDQTPTQPSVEALGLCGDASTTWGTHEWSPESWGLQDSISTHSASAYSTFSVSEESLASAEELSGYDFGTEYRGYAMPNLVADDYQRRELLGNGFGV